MCISSIDRVHIRAASTPARPWPARHALHQPVPYGKAICCATWMTPGTRLPCTYRQAISMITDEIPWLTQEDKQWIMEGGISEWLG